MWIGRYVCLPDHMFRVLAKKYPVHLNGCEFAKYTYTRKPRNPSRSDGRLYIVLLYEKQADKSRKSNYIFFERKHFFTLQLQCTIVLTEVESISIIIAEIKLILWIWYKNSMQRHMTNI